MNEGLRRRIDAAIASPSLHPNYARELLRQARDELVPTRDGGLGGEEYDPARLVLNAWYLSRYGSRS
jgi:hypothetical protein